MTLVYNVADLVNKTAFVVIVLLGARNTIEAQQVHPPHKTMAQGR